MAYKLIEQEYSPIPGVIKGSFVLDSAEDAADLPRSAPGSTAIVAEKGGAVFIVNASGEWKEI